MTGHWLIRQNPSPSRAWSRIYEYDYIRGRVFYSAPLLGTPFDVYRWIPVAKILIGTTNYKALENKARKTILHYLARHLGHEAIVGSKHRYHVVRSSLNQCRHVPFGKWVTRIAGDLDVLLDFSATKPVEICLSRFNNAERSRRQHLHGKDYIGSHARFGWYFLNNRSQKVPCCSGYEALFAAYLKWNKIPFDYQKWVISHSSTLGAWTRFAFDDKYRPSSFTYIPDFYLPDTDEFFELKGWQSPGRTQAKAIPYLKRKGYRIRVLEWAQLRQLLGISVSYETCLNRARKYYSQPSRAFADPQWVKERLSAVNPHQHQPR